MADTSTPSPMSHAELKDELDDQFLRRQWVVQRVGWGLMLFIIILALLGILGTSPMATKVETREVGDARYEVEHARFSRYQLLDRMHVRVDAPSAAGEELTISFSREWTENNAIRGSTPEADGGGAGADGGTYTYQIEDWSEPITVAFEYEARKSFRSPGTLTITAGESAPVTLPIDAWVHP